MRKLNIISQCVGLFVGVMTVVSCSGPLSIPNIISDWTEGLSQDTVPIKMVSLTIDEISYYNFIGEVEHEERMVEIYVPKSLTDFSSVDIDFKYKENYEYGDTFDRNDVAFSYDNELGAHAYVIPVLGSTGDYRIVIRRINELAYYYDADGDGEGESEPYIPIFTGEDLDSRGPNDIQENLDGHYILMNDIFLYDDFAPIGNGDIRFSGIFEGNKKQIAGLRLFYLAGGRYVGFFGKLSASAHIRNFVLISPSIRGEHNVGAVVGNNKGTISGVGVVGTEENEISIRLIATGSYVGGLVGYNEESGRIEDSYISGGKVYLISFLTYGAHLGGLVGENEGTIVRSYANIRVKKSGVNTRAGGLVGKVPDRQAHISQSYFDRVVATRKAIGVNNAADESTIDIGEFYSLDGLVYTADPAVDDRARPLQRHNFSGWDFQERWEWIDDGQWPVLQGQMPVTLLEEED